MKAAVPALDAGGSGCGSSARLGRRDRLAATGAGGGELGETGAWAA